MCVVALALNAHPHWRLVLAANRDEFHARPSAPLAHWDGADDHIIGGRDLQSGGTWLGVSEQGRLAVVTNIRTGKMPDPDKTSRGALVADFLRGEDMVATNLDSYNAFSLFALDGEEAWFAANRPGPAVQPLQDGIHSLSNGLPEEEWPRRHRVHDGLADWLKRDGTPEGLLTLLTDETPLSDDGSHAPIFIRNDQYGTRCSTVVAVDRDGMGVMTERSFGPNGVDSGTIALNLSWPALSPTAP